MGQALAQLSCLSSLDPSSVISPLVNLFPSLKFDSKDLIAWYKHVVLHKNPQENNENPLPPYMITKTDFVSCCAKKQNTWIQYEKETQPSDEVFWTFIFDYFDKEGRGHFDFRFFLMALLNFCDDNPSDKFQMFFTLNDILLEPTGRPKSQDMRDMEPHKFELHHFNTPRWCDHCFKFIWGLGKQGYKCKVCAYSIHKSFCYHQVVNNRTCEGVKLEKKEWVERMKQNPPSTISTSSFNLRRESTLPQITVNNARASMRPLGSEPTLTSSNSSNSSDTPSPPGSQTRKKFAQTMSKDQLSKMSASQVKRQEAIWELIETEAEYVRNMNNFFTVFLLPAGSKFFPRLKNVTLMFSPVASIISVNKKLLKELKSRQKGTPDMIINKIGDVFTATGDRLRLYSHFCSVHQAFKNMIANYGRKNEDFGEFVKEVESRTDFNKLKIRDIMIMPVQRLCRYPLLLNEIFKNTPPDHADYQDLKVAVQIMKDVTSFVDSIASQTEQFGILSPYFKSHSPRNQRQGSRRQKKLEERPKINVSTPTLNISVPYAREATTIGLYTPEEVWKALEEKDLEKLFILLKDEEASKLRDDKGNTLLHVALATGFPDRDLCLLLCGSGEPCASNKKAWTPLHTACIYSTQGTSHVEMAIMLIKEFSVPVNAAALDGSLPIHYLVQTKTDPEKMIELIDLMLANGVNLNHANIKGKTPIQVAISSSCHPTVVSHLLKSGTDPFMTNKAGLTILHMCIIENKNSYISLILDLFPNFIKLYDVEELTELANDNSETISLIQEYAQKQQEASKSSRVSKRPEEPTKKVVELEKLNVRRSDSQMRENSSSPKSKSSRSSSELDKTRDVQILRRESSKEIHSILFEKKINGQEKEETLCAACGLPVVDKAFVVVSKDNSRWGKYHQSCLPSSSNN
eukprot:TRINITY_DN2733_c0_g1_i1.p1 TRINITY_DN2733_c0_g1~~TRINITY_DN2733_c0_g1_i1.p1  ORF type:complete len:914 (-),score=171.69 TRINITY_DN2733_c0_g1_i1:142-2883(-)